MQTGRLYVTSASENDARVAGLLPTEPTEDVSHILDSSKLNLPSEEEPAVADTKDYLPYPDVEWVVDVEIIGEPHRDPKEVSAVRPRARKIRPIHRVWP